jgi:hypothetical protein
MAAADSLFFRSELHYAGRVETSSEAIGGRSSASACFRAPLMRQQGHRRPPNITSTRGRERAEIGRISRQVFTDVSAWRKSLRGGKRG